MKPDLIRNTRTRPDSAPDFLCTTSEVKGQTREGLCVTNGNPAAITAWPPCWIWVLGWMRRFWLIFPTLSSESPSSRNRAFNVPHVQGSGSDSGSVKLWEGFCVSHTWSVETMHRVNHFQPLGCDVTVASMWAEFHLETKESSETFGQFNDFGLQNTFLKMFFYFFIFFTAGTCHFLFSLRTLTPNIGQRFYEWVNG